VIRTARALAPPVLETGVGIPAHHSPPAYRVEQQPIAAVSELVESGRRAPDAWVRITARDEAGRR
jgi:hypothetical protein